MADYYPLLTRALDALTDRSPAMRRAVFDRARAALTEQLRNLNPPLSEAEIARETLALDEAIRRVEAEYATEGPAPADTPDIATLAPPEPVPAGGTLARPEGTASVDDDHAAIAPLPAEPIRERPRINTVAAQPERQGAMRSVVLGAVLAIVIGTIAVAAWFLRDNPSELPRQPVVAEAPPAAPNESKITDRVVGERPSGQPTPGGAGPSSDLPVAQRAILYEENPAAPQQPKATAGRALWRLDSVNAGQGQPLETVVRATVEIPEAQMSMSLLMRRNLDQTLPASHTIELSFNTPPGDSARMVRDVGLLQFKNEEAVRGTPVAGLPVPVKENIFLIGLSNLTSDIERNTDLIANRNWIDLPIRFASGQRAILSFEKGIAGEQVLKEAFRRW